MKQKQYIAEKDNLFVNNNIKPLAVPYLQRNSGEIIDGGGSPSTDSRTSEERNRDYFHPIKGAVERFKASMNNNTNPLIGLKNTVLPAAAGAAVLTMPAVTVANLLTPRIMSGIAGNIYLGNALHSQNNPYAEAGVSIAGRILPPQLNEQSKRIGGINDFKQAKEEFKRGNIKKGIFNVATGIGGVYDSSWIPGRYDDYIDKALEVLNLAGDTNDAIKAVKKYNQPNQQIDKTKLQGKRRINQNKSEQ